VVVSNMLKHPGKLIWLAGKWTRVEDVFPIENGDIPASYVSLPEGNVPPEPWGNDPI